MQIDAAHPPTHAEWRRFLGRTLSLLAVASLLAAVVCFIAYNWNHMGPSVKFALVEAAILGLTLLSWWLGLENQSGQLAIFSAAFLVGPLLAIYGQAYPSGAPLSNLLFMWAGIAAVIAALANTEGSWLLALTILDSAFFFWSPFSRGGFLFDGEATKYLAIGLANLGAFGFTLILPKWLPSKASPRLLIFSGASFLNIAFVIVNFETWRKWNFGTSFWAFPAVVAILAFYSLSKRDLFAMVIALLGTLSIVNTLLLHRFNEDIWLGLTFLNLIAGATGVYLLNNLYRSWKDRS